MRLWLERSTGDGGDELRGCVVLAPRPAGRIDRRRRADVVIVVEGMYAAAAGAAAAASSSSPATSPARAAVDGAARAAGLISTVGRATDDAADLFRGTAALVAARSVRPVSEPLRGFFVNT